MIFLKLWRRIPQEIHGLEKSAVSGLEKAK